MNKNNLLLTVPLALSLLNTLSSSAMAYAQELHKASLQRGEKPLSNTMHPAYPRLLSGKADATTQPALNLASAAYKSSEPSLYKATAAIIDTDKSIVLAPADWQGPPPVKNGRYNWSQKSNTSTCRIAICTGKQIKCLDDWQIYKIDGASNAALIGTIRFMPRFSEDFQLLPEGALKQMALLLDNMIGPASKDNGGFNPPGKLKTKVRHMWGNLLYRPRALEQPPDTRAAVDAAIGQWSQESASNLGQARRLNALYPAALNDLSNYYKSHLKMAAPEAKALATKNLDLALRTHFYL